MVDREQGGAKRAEGMADHAAGPASGAAHVVYRTTERARGTGAETAEALSASLEDYLEAILLLERSSRVARVSEIAEQLGVSRPSVTSALKNLGGRGLVSHAPYGHVTLTDEGARLARGVERRHLAIRDFLTGVLAIPEDLAEVSACRLEHVLEAEVLAHFVAYAERQGVTPTSPDASTATGATGVAL